MLEWRIVGVKGKRDEGLKSVRLILQMAQAQQVVDAIFFVFDMPIEHGAI